MRSRLGLTLPLIQAWMWILPVGLYAALTLLHEIPPFSYIPGMPPIIDAALSFALAMLVAFRVNRAYERWWEARKLWGTLVNVSRNLAVKTRRLHQPTAEERVALRQLIVAFCRGLKDHLRGQPNLQALEGFENAKERPAHLPSFLVSRIYAFLADWKRSGRISDTDMLVLDSELRVLLDVCGACERIKTTLISISWRILTWQSITIYIIVFPWGVVDDFQGWTIPIAMLASYFLIAGESIAHYIEEPFGQHVDNVDLDRICDGIESTVDQILSDDH